MKATIQLLSGGYACPGAFPGGQITVYPWDRDVDHWQLERSQRGGSRRNLLYDLLPRIADLPAADGLFVESLMSSIAQGDEAAKERVRAFLEKRAAKVSRPS